VCVCFVCVCVCVVSVSTGTRRQWCIHDDIGSRRIGQSVLERVCVWIPQRNHRSKGHRQNTVPHKRTAKVGLAKVLVHRKREFQVCVYTDVQCQVCAQTKRYTTAGQQRTFRPQRKPQLGHHTRYDRSRPSDRTTCVGRQFRLFRDIQLQMNTDDTIRA
jgi:hypothetical protein